jgi:hypothetical protein
VPDSSVVPASRNGSRQWLTVLAATALAVCLSAWWAGSASADQVPFHSDLNHGIVKLGPVQANMLDDTTGPVTLDGTLDDATGDFTVPVDGITLPPTNFTYSFPGIGDIPVKLTYTPNGPITGNFDQATGALEADMSVDTLLNAFGTAVVCDFNPIPLHFSTAATLPFMAVPFASGLEGPGAVAADWTELPDPTFDPNSQLSAQFCPTLGALGVPGGVWLSHDIASPPKPAKLDKVAVEPKSKTVKYLGSASFTFSVGNSGDFDANDVELCVDVPKQLRLVGDECRSVGTLAPDGNASEKFKVKAKRSAAGRLLNLKFTASGTDLAKRTATATLKVKKN